MGSHLLDIMLGMELTMLLSTLVSDSVMNTCCLLNALIVGAPAGNNKMHEEKHSTIQ